MTTWTTLFRSDSEIHYPYGRVTAKGHSIVPSLKIDDDGLMDDDDNSKWDPVYREAQHDFTPEKQLIVLFEN